MKYCYSKSLGLLMALLCNVSVSMVAQNLSSYNRHYIIVVDQGAVQSHPNMMSLYECIRDAFTTGKTPDGLDYQSYGTCEFDEYTDEISLFYSGLDNESYRDIHYLCDGKSSIDPQVLIDKKLTPNFIHSYKKYSDFSGSVGSFLDANLKPLMDKNVQPSIDVRVGLNEYIYPFVLSQLNVTKPAVKYYVLVVSTFNSTGSQQNVHQSQVVPMFARNNQYIKAFDEKNGSLVKMFTFSQNEIKYLLPTNPKDNNNNPKFIGGHLDLTALAKTGLKSISSVRMNQLRYKSDNFHISQTKFSFPIDSSIIVSRISIAISGGSLIDHPIMYSVADSPETAMALFNASDYSFTINGFDIDIPEACPGDDYTLKYTFFVDLVDSKHKAILPMAYEEDVHASLEESDFVAPPTTIDTIWPYLVLGFIIIAIILALIFIARSRGNKRRVNLNFHFLPISNEQYMDVSNQRVVAYDCWYMEEDVLGRTETGICVKGKMTPESKALAMKPYEYRLEYRVEDVDDDDNFTFRPIGRDTMGCDYQLSHWYRVEVAKDGTFEVRIAAYLDVQKHPELNNLDDQFWQTDHILKTQVFFRVVAINKGDRDKLKAPTILDTNIKLVNIVGVSSTEATAIYHFIARPRFTLEHSWVAFDPGTSGACAAFITGGNISNQDNIHLIYEAVEDTKKQVYYKPIYPSKINITDDARAFRQLGNGEEILDVSAWEEGAKSSEHKDFMFGWPAEQLIKANNFQSIKKLLGYTSTQTIIKSRGEKELQISGLRLAQLLMKGLYSHTKRYMEDIVNQPDKYRNVIHPFADPIDIRNLYMEKNGVFNPKRAIVAVPNNYTLPKIQEMVNTVKALNQFREVHYLYESEGVLMHYLHLNWMQLRNDKNKIFVVFDMGGATINATAFRISKLSIDKVGNTSGIEVETIGKIGYCVGGDDIDYAIIRQLYKLEALAAKFAAEEEIKANMATHKQLLIKVARELKLEMIDIVNCDRTNINWLQSREGFNVQLSHLVKVLGWPEDVEITDKEFQMWSNPAQICASDIFEEYIYSKVEDATKELFASIPVRFNVKEIELIFSGRSTLFPYICDRVKKAIKAPCCAWTGLQVDGHLDANAVKTAVVQGACWYANFSKHITIKHDIVTTAFGYIDHQGGEEKFVSLIAPGTKFTNGNIQVDKRVPIAPLLLQEVQFVQMQGADYGKILREFRAQSGKNKHKINILDKVTPGSEVMSISVALDERSNFTYEIEAAGVVRPITNETYPLSRLRADSQVRTEISDENNDSYLFAAISSVTETRDELQQINEAPASIKQNKSRW